MLASETGNVCEQERLCVCGGGGGEIECFCVS